MALIKCSECGSQVSDKAAACPQCGAPVRSTVANAVPVVVKQEPSFKWWLWIPLGLVAIFLLFGALTPKNVAEANRFARVCRDMAGGNQHAQAACDREEARLRTPAQSVSGPPANTSFVAEPPRPPSSASNEEIMRQVMYPELYKKPAGK